MTAALLPATRGGSWALVLCLDGSLAHVPMGAPKERWSRGIPCLEAPFSFHAHPSCTPHAPWGHSAVPGCCLAGLLPPTMCCAQTCSFPPPGAIPHESVFLLSLGCFPGPSLLLPLYSIFNRSPWLWISGSSDWGGSALPTQKTLWETKSPAPGPAFPVPVEASLLGSKEMLSYSDCRKMASYHSHNCH